MITQSDITPQASIEEQLKTYAFEVGSQWQESSIEAVRRFSRYLKPKDTIIDLGCGDGAATKAFQDKDFTVIGVDINSKKLKQNPTETVCADMVTYLKDNNQIPNIFIHQALEHLPNPQEVLVLIHEKLLEGGLVYIEVPNNDELHSVHHSTFDRPEDLLPIGFEVIEQSSDNLEHYLIARKPRLKLNLGSGNSRIDGFISIDKYDVEADIMADVCELPYADETIEELVAYQVIEHLPFWKTHITSNSNAELYLPVFFQECYRVLKKGGILTTECPDVEYIAQRIVETGEISYNTICNLWGEYYRPWDKERYPDWEHQAGSLHINGFTWKDIQNTAKYVGFKVERLPLEEKHKDYQYPENLSVRWTK